MRSYEGGFIKGHYRLGSMSPYRSLEALGGLMIAGLWRPYNWRPLEAL